MRSAAGRGSSAARSRSTDGASYGKDLCGDELFLLEGPRGKIGRSPRINVDYAGEWAARPWRFYERANRSVSVKPRS
jgi:DNA-3-methyladenine glycosylase